MKQESTIKAEGVVIEDRSNSMFVVELDNGHQVLCTICGKMRTKNIRVLVGDRVAVDVSIYDINSGRIMFRYSENGDKQKLTGSRDTKAKKKLKGEKKKK